MCLICKRHVSNEWWNHVNDNANELDFWGTTFDQNIFHPISYHLHMGSSKWRLVNSMAYLSGKRTSRWHMLGRQIRRFTALWPCECHTDSQMWSWRIVSTIPSIVLMLTWLTNDTINCPDPWNRWFWRKQEQKIHQLCLFSVTHSWSCNNFWRT